MTRFPQAVLTKVHRFLVEIHAGGGVTTQRALVPNGLAKIIACDRAAFNEFDYANQRVMIPSPVPAYWKLYGDIMVRHLWDHALFDPALAFSLHRAVTFGDRRDDPRWRKSPLYHDYYLQVGARQQLSVAFFRRGTSWCGLNTNRSSGRDFSATDRAVLELVSLHVACAWRNALELSALRARAARPADTRESARHLLTVSHEGRLISEVDAATVVLIRRYCGEDSGAGRMLPTDLAEWFRAQRIGLATSDALVRPPAVLTVPGPEGVLVARLAESDQVTAVILLEETCGTPPAGDTQGEPRLTRRENEILHWITEGKRDAEIAAILGCATKTVGKHVEHILEKLGVETRTAAARAAFENGGRGHA